MNPPMNQPELYMCLIGCKPAGRHIEQHDIFFGIAATATELIRQMEAFWPDGGRLHLDAWRRVSCVGGVEVQVRQKSAEGLNAQKWKASSKESDRKLYFINLGGYQEGKFEEYHHKLITVQPGKAAAIKAAKQEGFFIQAAGSHVDDQYGVDIDDLYNVEDILPEALKAEYCLIFKDIPEQEALNNQEDTWQIGYTKLSQLEKMF